MNNRGAQYPSIAEEIKGIAKADPVHRKLFVRGLAWNTTSESLCAVSALLLADCDACHRAFFPISQYLKRPVLVASSFPYSKDIFAEAIVSDSFMVHGPGI